MLTLAAAPVAAQSDAPTVARCSALMDSVQRVAPPGPPDFNSITRVVRPCAERIDIASTPAAQLVALARLLRGVGDDRHAGMAIDRLLADPHLTRAEHIQALGTALEIYGNTDTTFVRSSQLVRELDSVESDQLDQRILAHEMLVRSAYAVNRADVERREATTLIELAALAAGRDSLAHLRASAISLATGALADLLANEHQGEHIGAFVDSMQRRFPDLHELPARLAPIRVHYELIGHPAPVLRADHWIGDSVSTPDTHGRVRVLAFTAHWCAPCRESYPALVATQRRHGASAVEIVLATQTYGYFGSETVETAEEIRRDSVMYARELPIPHAIAVERCTAADCDDWHGANHRTYSVKPLPMFVIVDSTGIVRDVWTGWTADGAARVERDVAALTKSTASR